MDVRPEDFVNLDVTSAFSFLWGTFEPEGLAELTASRGQRAVALTDLWSLHGVVRFCRACRERGIRPLVGARVRLFGQGWVVLLAKDQRGYGNLCRLVSWGLLEGGRHTPADIPLSVLRAHRQGIVCIAGVHGGAVRFMAAGGLTDGAGIKLVALKHIFTGDEDLFVAVKDQLPLDREANPVLLHLAARLGIPAVAVPHAAFLQPEDLDLHQLLVGIQRHHHHREVEPLTSEGFAVADASSVYCSLLLGGLSEGMARGLVEQTAAIAERCSFSFPAGRLHPPRLRSPRQADRRLARACMKALAHKFRPVPAHYLKRLTEELEQISSRDLSDFFLLVAEICQRAKALGIRHSIRGSAAGSLVVHLLHGGPDPVRHGLLFERFMNAGRKDLPDIDIDFDSRRRDEITAWLMERFASPVESAQAALVATIHTFRPRSAVRLAARALGHGPREMARLVASLPWSLRGIRLSEAVERLPELADSPLKEDRRLLRLAASIEGLPFQASVHLGGVVLAPGEIMEWSPLWRGNKGFAVLQLDKDDVDRLGLLKIDLLGLRMHTAIEEALNALESQGRRVRHLMDDLPLDDVDVYHLLRSGQTLGIFQLESSGQRNLVCRLEPDCFEDIVAEISLFRPGPVQGDMVHRYLRNRAETRRSGRPWRPSRALEPLEEILRPTHGVIVFQEQVLAIAHYFAGFSYAEADAFRRAMTKGRSRGEMERLKAAFMAGAQAMGRPKAHAEQVFKMVSAFAAYGFCRAHAVSFAHITWQSAWLKTHHPAAFYIGLLNAGHVGSYPPSVILNEARRRGIRILPPHVNLSGRGYLMEGQERDVGEGGIRCPLWIVRQIGRRRSEAILAEREARGPFSSMEEFVSRTRLPRRAVEMLRLAGGFDGLGREPIRASCISDGDRDDGEVAWTGAA